MTDDEIREVFAEVTRVGVDPNRPPGLALGTGFRDAEFLAWLRTLPDGLGHDAFVDLMNEQINNAQPNALPIPADDSVARPQRLCPTTEQLNAGMDVLLSEWDPLGARLGDLSNEAVSDAAYDALTVALSGERPDVVELQIAAMLGDVEERGFGIPPSPSEQRRYLARRLIQVVLDHPGPRHEVDGWQRDDQHGQTGGRQTVRLGPRGDELPALDLTAPCTECGAIGTVAVVMREMEPLVSRYCPECWSKVRDKYFGVSMFTEPPDRSTPEGRIATLDRIAEVMLLQAREAPRYVSSAMWDDRLPFMRMALGANADQSPAVREQHLRRFASELVRLAPEMYGPMPPELDAFVRDHGGPDA